MRRTVPVPVTPVSGVWSAVAAHTDEAGDHGQHYCGDSKQNNCQSIVLTREINTATLYDKSATPYEKTPRHIYFGSLGEIVWFVLFCFCVGGQSNVLVFSSR